MPLTTSKDDSGDWQVSGTGRGSAPVPLGRIKFQVGSHLIGFDDKFAEPVIMNAFWDPASGPDADLLASQGLYSYLGYLQFMQISFSGLPIPPRIYGGRLADREPYVYGRVQQFIDFMGPARAKGRNIVGSNYPFYAFNGMLSDPGILSTGDLTVVPRPNGWLRPGDPGPSGPDGEALCAAIRAESAPGLLTAGDISQWLAGDPPDDPAVPEYLKIVVTTGDLARSEPYQIAMSTLADSVLAGISTDHIYAQAIGPYVLLSLPQEEDFGPTLIITKTNEPAVLVYMLSEYDMADLIGSTVRDALTRIRAFALASDVTGSMLSPPPPSYGFSPIDPFPMTLPADQFVMELRYWTVGAGVRLFSERIEFISGFTWSLRFQFDPVAETLDFTAITAPAAISSFGLPEGLTGYNEALGGQKLPDIDISNFTQAALRRDNFASRGSLLVVNSSGQVISP